MEILLPIETVRKYWRYCQRFMTGYRIGLTGARLGYSVKKYSGHRAIPGGVVTELNKLAESNKIPHNLLPGLAEMNDIMAEKEN